MIARISRTACAALLALSAVCATPSPAGADQEAAGKIGAIELIVPFGPGGGADQLARKIRPHLEEALRTEVSVTNLPGATGNVGMAKLLKAPADGRTLAVLTGDTLAYLAHLNAGWAPADIVPVAIMMRESSLLFVPSDSRLKSWREFENEARQRPYTLRVAISGLGSPDHIALQQLGGAGIQLLPVPFGSPEDRYAAVLRGAADALYEQPGDVKTLLDSNQLRPLLCFGEKPHSSHKNIPTSQELGYGPGVSQFRAIVVKSGTDLQMVRQYEEALTKIAATPDFKGFLEDRGIYENSFLPNAAAWEFMEAELRSVRKIVNRLPLHSRYFLDVKSSDHYYVEPF